MTTVTLLPLGQDGPDSMQLTVLAEEVITAQYVRSNVPNPHNFKTKD